MTIPFVDTLARTGNCSFNSTGEYKSNTSIDKADARRQNEA
jgi:hypothetical protein